MTRVVTWNMEGGTHKEQSKWQDAVVPLMSGGTDADVLCLQEAGGLPPSAVAYTPPPPVPDWLAPPPAKFVWRFCTWQPGKKKVFYILWGETDPGGHRVNLALVTQQLPDGFWYAPSGAVGGRPALGVQLAGENVFSLHAFSGGGGNAPALITSIQATVGGGSDFVAAGDYNREPPWAPPHGNLCPPDKPTRWKTKKKLDYMVRTDPAITGIVLDNLVLSDHFPVVFDI